MQYMAELRKLADKREFGDHFDEALADPLMLGVHSAKLLTKKKLTLEKAYSLVQGLETTMKQAGKVQATMSPGAPMNYVDKKPQRSPFFLCGKTNHSPDNCIYRQKCFFFFFFFFARNQYIERF